MHTTDKLKELLKAGLHYEESNGYYWLNATPYTEEEFEKLLNSPEPLIEPDKEVSAEKAADIKAKEFFEGVLNMDWMSEEEKQTIYDAAELYAQGRVRYASLVSKKEVGEGKDLEVSLGNSGNASVASHNSSSSNTNEQ
jgi:hypothetical protein